MKKIITISREFGSSGGTIGKAVADRLGYEYYDKEIILRSAREANLDIASLEKWDERIPMNFGFAQSLFDFYNKPLNEKLFEAQKKVIREIGEKGNCVIVGRNANTILGEYDNTLHIFIHAHPYWRLQHLKEKMPDTSEAKIMERMKDVDKKRKKYCAYYTNTVFGMSDYYDLSLCSSSLGVDTCIDLICELAQK
ncbi:AAA family ATPase [Frisingicoccus sp.]|uniref:cytidylate kinase-like family protein n=1 Tax=Frisingicoccus sp. TaxID=1918627 RepID=UPI002EC342F2|nr:cytidylate kinase-like family protein [Frisingicoccus sp.]